MLKLPPMHVSITSNIREIGISILEGCVSKSQHFQKMIECIITSEWLELQQRYIHKLHMEVWTFSEAYDNIQKLKTKNCEMKDQSTPTLIIVKSVLRPHILASIPIFANSQSRLWCFNITFHKFWTIPAPANAH
jgi:hypothetical protein